LIVSSAAKFGYGKTDKKPASMMKTILLVDDELDILSSIGEILNRFGYQVIAKPNAKEALSVVRQGTKIDLIITDYRMPGMDGLEFLNALRLENSSVPVIILTAYGAVESYLKSLSLGVFEYLNKPIKAKELGRIVQAALESAGHEPSTSGSSEQSAGT
jgi:DNA-binding NtrC family response regulator